MAGGPQPVSGVGSYPGRAHAETAAGNRPACCLRVVGPAFVCFLLRGPHPRPLQAAAACGPCGSEAPSSPGAGAPGPVAPERLQAGLTRVSVQSQEAVARLSPWASSPATRDALPSR